MREEDGLEISLRRVHLVERDDSKEEKVVENRDEAAAKEESENGEAPAEASASPSLSSLLSDLRPPEDGLDLSKSLSHVHVFR